MSTNEVKFSKEASAIAIHCQRSLRGRNARYDVNNKKWERANIAAYRIQTMFRRWRWMQLTRRRLIKKFPVSQKKGYKDKSWAKMLSNKATREEKMQIWRNVIELRRAYRDTDSELCLKALLAADGNLSRAVPLLGNKDFRFQADYSASLSEDFIECLNPYVRGYLANEEDDKHIIKSAAMRNKNTSNRRAHRHLHASLLSSNSLPPPLIDLEPVVMQAYFSKHCRKSKK